MIRVFFGNPGCGKTTQACKMMKQAQRKRSPYEYVFCNFKLNSEYDIGYSITTELMSTLGEWTFPPASYIAVDESSIQYNNRKYKTLPQYTIEWFKLHRHYGVNIDLFSQSWDDMDITLRRLADQLWYMRRIGPFTMLRRVYKTVMIDDNTHQIIDGYRMEKGIWLLLQPLRLLGLSFIFPQLKGWKLTFRPLYYKYFNSWDHPDIPIVDTPTT